MGEYSRGILGTVDILVNNAGIFHSTPVEDVTEEEWDNIMAINLKSVFLLAKGIALYEEKALRENTNPRHWRAGMAGL